MTNTTNSNKIIISCSTIHKFATEVAEKSQIPHIALLTQAYSCHELKIKLDNEYELKDKQIILFQGLQTSVNDAIYELLLAIELITRHQPTEIIVCLPYLYYSR